AKDAAKLFGTTLSFAGTEFTSSGLKGSDKATGVTLTSDGAAANAAVGSYAIVASNATGTGLSNYNITYVNGTLTVSPSTGSAYILNGSASGAVSVSGQAILTVNGTFFVDSSSSSAVTGTGKGQIVASNGIYVQGGFSWTSSYTKPTNNGQPSTTADPYAN